MAKEPKDPQGGIDPSGGMKKEPTLKLRAKAQINVDGVIIHAGQIFELPERHALGLVGTGNVEQIPD